MDRLDDQNALSAEGLLTLIEHHLPALWQVHAHSGNRSLRLILRQAEALLAARAGSGGVHTRCTQSKRRSEAGD